MASVIVDGLVLPISIGGHPALDFCNTRAAWGAEVPKEYLTGYPQFCLWARENGLFDPATAARLARRAARTPSEAASVVTRAVRLRDALYPVLLGRGERREWTVINRELGTAAARLRLQPSGGAAARLRLQPSVGAPARWGWTDPADLAAPLHAVVWSAAELLVRPAGAAVGACPGSGCGWLFADPYGRRRWCSMAWCGNRAKARRHAARERAQVG